jgi:hypothetical protein
MTGTTYKTEVDKKTDGEKWMVDRKTKEQNCDNKTKTKTELEWHGDRDERKWDVAAAFTYGPPTAASSCVQYLRPIQFPLLYQYAPMTFLPQFNHTFIQTTVWISHQAKFRATISKHLHSAYSN